MSVFDEIRETIDKLRAKLRGEPEHRTREDDQGEAGINEACGNYDYPRIISVDYKSKANSLDHHTNQFDLVNNTRTHTIIRRGASFAIDIELDEAVDLKRKQNLKIYLNFGEQPIVSKGTRGVLTFTGKRLFNKGKEYWDHKVIKEEGNKAYLEIYVPYDAPVGLWEVEFEVSNTKERNRSKRHFIHSEQNFYILFNPWVKDDDVYMDDEENREEYVLNDVGIIGQASQSGQVVSRSWIFGQFDEVVLPACVKLIMERAQISYENMGKPVDVSRAISSVINSQDADRGVLVGRWYEPYTGGSEPHTWTGSINILENFLKNGKSVKYGQCWVFSGVTTTVCRALGIPCRSVTNYESAHDRNSNLTIDKYYDGRGREYGRYNKPEYWMTIPNPPESIWNFHVWNDVWMARPSLPPRYGGWQAIDATPQEISHGLNQCGPASLEAVKNGDIHLKYDVDFVHAEVNAAEASWERDDSQDDGFKIKSLKKNNIGIKVLTKKPGKHFGSEFLDITNQYKPPENSSAERIIFLSAAKKARADARRYKCEVDEDVEFSLVDIDRIMIGEDYTIKVKTKNLAQTKRTVLMYIDSYSQFYNGVIGHLVKETDREFELQGEQEKVLDLPVKYSDYFDKLVEYASMKIMAKADVKETKQTWSAQDDFQILKPSLEVRLPECGIVGKFLLAKVSFTNPLDIPLQKCSITFDGPGLIRPTKKILQDVKPKSEMVCEYQIEPKISGMRVLTCVFQSTKLVNINGSGVTEIIDE